MSGTMSPVSPVSPALNQWDALSLFLTDAALPLDNNQSEH